MSDLKVETPIFSTIKNECPKIPELAFELFDAFGQDTIFNVAQNEIVGCTFSLAYAYVLKEQTKITDNITTNILFMIFS